MDQQRASPAPSGADPPEAAVSALLTARRQSRPVRPTGRTRARLAALVLSVAAGTVTVMFFGPAPTLAVIAAVTLACRWMPERRAVGVGRAAA
jgi:fatty acid desaturase